VSIQTKPSSIPRIKDIPIDWNLKKIRFATTLRSEVGQYTQDDIYIGLENVESFTGNIIETETTYEEGIYDVFKNGDVLFGKLRPYLAKAFIASFDGFCTSEFLIFKKYEGNTKFLFYYLLSNGFLKEVNASTFGSKMPRADWEYIRNMYIPVIPLSEQNAIVAFLDEKCSIIDSIIKDMNEQIDILNQYKKVVITETITQGLDKNAPMKDSGVKWIGKIPAHWLETKLKYICSMQSGDNLISEEILDEGFPVYGGNGQRGFFDDYNSDDEVVLIGRQGALCGNIHRVSGKLWATDHAVITNNFNNSDIDFLYYILYAMNLNQYSVASAQPGLAVENIIKLNVCIPDLDEQQQLVAFLDSKCAEIDKVISEKQESIRTMQDYKKSLIYEYTTGKKRVRGFA
jgi:type I restriction enzyme S subunit